MDRLGTGVEKGARSGVMPGGGGDRLRERND